MRTSDCILLPRSAAVKHLIHGAAGGNEAEEDQQHGPERGARALHWPGVAPEENAVLVVELQPADRRQDEGEHNGAQPAGERHDVAQVVHDERDGDGRTKDREREAEQARQTEEAARSKVARLSNVYRDLTR